MEEFSGRDVQGVGDKIWDVVARQPHDGGGTQSVIFRKRSSSPCHSVREPSGRVYLEFHPMNPGDEGSDSIDVKIFRVRESNEPGRDTERKLRPAVRCRVVHGGPPLHRAQRPSPKGLHTLAFELTGEMERVVWQRCLD